MSATSAEQQIDAKPDELEVVKMLAHVAMALDVAALNAQSIFDRDPNHPLVRTVLILRSAYKLVAETELCRGGIALVEKPEQPDAQPTHEAPANLQ